MSRQSDTSDSLFLLDTIDDMRSHLLGMLQKGKQNVVIFSRYLNPLLFNHQDISDALSAIARTHPHAEIRLLVEHPQTIVEDNHLLLLFSQRLPSKIKIQRLISPSTEDSEFMIVDDDKLWLQHKQESYTGFANYDARPEAKRFMGLFNELWRNSEEDVRLRRLSL